MKFCKDCKYIATRTPLRPDLSYCTHPKVAQINLVTGEQNGGYCENARKDYKEVTTCGTLALYWEPAQ